jgi:four helix bundle protein
MKTNKKNDITDRTFNFSIDIVKFAKHIPKDPVGFVLGRQLIKSATSIGANVEEATGAYSKDDFTFKMNIALKEARETNYWLRLLRESGVVKNKAIEKLLDESLNVKNILSAIVKTSKGKREKHLKV